MKPDEFIQALRERRSQLRLTMDEVGRRMGVTQQHVSHMEHGRRAVKLHHLDAWCQALDFELELFPPGTSPQDAELIGALLKVAPTLSSDQRQLLLRLFASFDDRSEPTGDRTT